MILLRVTIVIMIASWLASPVSARIDVDSVIASIVKVRSFVDNEIAAEGSGFVVGDGYIVTNAHLLVEAERITVLSLASGAEYVASQHGELHADRNIALLRVTGLQLPSLSLSDQRMATGRIVETLQWNRDAGVRVVIGSIGAFLVIPFEVSDLNPSENNAVSETSSTSRSTVTRVTDADLQDVASPDVDTTPGLIQHNALIASTGFGMPLFNECGDVIGMNVPDPAMHTWPFQSAANPVGSVAALMTREMIPLLTASNVTPTVTTAECLSEVEQAERERDQAEEQLRALEQAAQDSLNLERSARLSAEEAARASEEEAEAVKSALRESEQARVSADSLHRIHTDSLQMASADSLAQLESFADSVQTALQDSLVAETDQFTERQREIIFAAVVLLIVVLIGWMLYARKKKVQISNVSDRASSAEQEAEAARKAAEAAPVPASFKCVLDGSDNTGRAFVVNISELALGYTAGVILGRSPADSEFIVDHQEVSREHVRLVQKAGILEVEDLDTLNGTRANGQPLSPGFPVVVNDGDRLEMGPVSFTVRLDRID